MNRTADPTPEQIKQRCKEIQKGWSEEERHERFSGMPRTNLIFAPREFRTTVQGRVLRKQLGD